MKQKKQPRVRLLWAHPPALWQAVGCSAVPLSLQPLHSLPLVARSSGRLTALLHTLALVESPDTTNVPEVVDVLVVVDPVPTVETEPVRALSGGSVLG